MPTLYERKYTHIRTWESNDENNYRMELFDTERSDEFKRPYLAYELYQNDELKFASRYLAEQDSIIDDNETISCILSLLIYSDETPARANCSKKRLKWLEDNLDNLKEYAEELQACC